MNNNKTKKKEEIQKKILENEVKDCTFKPTTNER